LAAVKEFRMREQKMLHAIFVGIAAAGLFGLLSVVVGGWLLLNFGGFENRRDAIVHILIAAMVILTACGGVVGVQLTHTSWNIWKEVCATMSFGATSATWVGGSILIQKALGVWEQNNS
jgi:hypothetical protein